MGLDRIIQLKQTVCSWLKLQYHPNPNVPFECCILNSCMSCPESEKETIFGCGELPTSKISVMDLQVLKAWEPDPARCSATSSTTSDCNLQHPVGLDL